MSNHEPVSRGDSDAMYPTEAHASSPIIFRTGNSNNSNIPDGAANNSTTNDDPTPGPSPP